MISLREIIVGLGAVALGLGLISMFCGSYHGVQAARHRKPDAPRRWLVELNPWQAGWFADQLDEVGLAHRRRALRFQKGALVCWIVALVLVLASSAVR